MAEKKEKFVTVGSIISFSIGALLAAYFIWAYPKFHTDSAMLEFSKEFDKIFKVYLLGIIFSFLGIYHSSKQCYQKNHLYRALVYCPGSFFSWPFYNAELNDMLYKMSDHSNDKFWQKRNIWYGIAALAVVILGISFIFLVRHKILRGRTFLGYF